MDIPNNLQDSKTEVIQYESFFAYLHVAFSLIGAVLLIRWEMIIGRCSVYYQDIAETHTGIMK